MDLGQITNGESLPGVGHLRRRFSTHAQNGNTRLVRTIKLVYFNCQFLHQN